jgi:hypothetical protein
MADYDLRKFTRHSTDLPIAVHFEELVASESSYLNNISEGGLSFNAMVPVDPGSVLHIRIPLNKPVFDFAGRVVWCTKKGLEYAVGVEFVSSDAAFRQRIVGLVRSIEEYRVRVNAQEGRNLSSQQAALEWIGKFSNELYGADPSL